MLLIYRNIILLQIKEKHATTSTSRTTTKVHPSLKNKRGSTILVLPPLIFTVKQSFKIYKEISQTFFRKQIEFLT